MKELEKAIEQLEKENTKIEKAQNRAKLLNQKERYKKVEYLKPLKEKLQVGKKIQITI